MSEKMRPSQWEEIITVQYKTFLGLTINQVRQQYRQFLSLGFWSLQEKCLVMEPQCSPLVQNFHHQDFLNIESKIGLLQWDLMGFP
jgi:hypothetical protein